MKKIQVDEVDALDGGRAFLIGCDGLLITELSEDRAYKITSMLNRAYELGKDEQDPLQPLIDMIDSVQKQLNGLVDEYTLAKHGDSEYYRFKLRTYMDEYTRWCNILQEAKRLKLTATTIDCDRVSVDWPGKRATTYTRSKIL